MATRKLKVELELETAKARRQAKELEQTAGSGGGSAAPAGNSAAASLDRVAKSAERSSSAFDRLGGQSARLTRGFAGVLKTYFEKDGERSAMAKDFEQAEAIYAVAREKDAKFAELSSTKPGADVAGNAAEAKRIIDGYSKSVADFVAEVREELKKANPDYERIAALRRNIDSSRGEIRRYENLVSSLESVQGRRTTPRTSTAALDALGRIGGDLVGRFTAPTPVRTRIESPRRE